MLDKKCISCDTRAMPNANSLRNLKPFNHGHDSRRGKGGRAPSFLKKYCKEMNIPKCDIQYIFQNIILCKTKGELKRMIEENKGDDLPAIVYGVVKAFLSDTVKGSFYTLDKALQWVYGKPEQTISLSGGLGINEMSLEEIDAAIEKHMKDEGYVKTDNSTGNTGDASEGNTD